MLEAIFIKNKQQPVFRIIYFFTREFSICQYCSGNVIDRSKSKKDVPQRQPAVTQVANNLAVASITGAKPGQQKRNCFHPGVSSLSRESLNFGDGRKVTGTDMLKAMVHFIWPKVCFSAII